MKLLFALVQFFPLSLFAAYAFWHGMPGDERWLEAFQLGGLAAAAQLAVMLPQARPMNRLVLAGNLYLLLGGTAVIAEQWWFLQLYNTLRESAIFLLMLLVGLAATFGTPSGFAGIPPGQPRAVRHASLVLLGATALCLVPAMLFEGTRLWSAVVPIVVLAVLQRYLVHRAQGRDSRTTQSSRRSA